MLSRESVRPLTNPATNSGDLADMIGMTSVYHELLEANVEKAEFYWHLIAHKFQQQRGYSRQEFEQLSWEADNLLEQIDNIGQEMQLRYDY